MFVLVVVLALGLCSVASAQPITQGAIIVSVDVTGVPLEVAPGGDLTVAGINAGYTARIVPDGADGIIDPGNDPMLSTVIGNSTVGIFDVNGDAGASVLLSFALPTELLPSGATVGAVRVAYNGTSATITDPGSGEAFYFDPTGPTVTRVPADGSPIHINLGGFFTVEPNSAADVYVADAILTAAYTAN